MSSRRAFIFHMCIPCCKTFSVVSRSSVIVKVKYQGHLKKMAVSRALVFHKYSFFLFTISAFITIFSKHIHSRFTRYIDRIFIVHEHICRLLSQGSFVCLGFNAVSTVFQLFNGDSSQIHVFLDYFFNQYLTSPLS